MRYLLWILLIISNLAVADSVNVHLSRDQVALGETLTVSFTLQGVSNNVYPDFTPLEKDFRVISNNFNNAVSMVNGVTSTQTFWELVLEPKHAGAIALPEISFGSVKSTPANLIVTKSVDPLTTQVNAPAFIKADISTTNPYVQSQVIYTFKLFYQAHIENPIVSIPQIPNTAIVQLNEGNSYQTTIKGKPYFVVEKTFALYPQKPLKIVIEPAQFDAQALSINSNDPFSPALINPIHLTTQAFTLNTRGIPSEFHGSTWLPAKNLAITEQWSTPPNQWEAGVPVTRTLLVAAEGLRADQLPDLVIDKIAGVNVYIAAPKRDNVLENKTVVGTLEQKVTYIPNSSASFTVPPVKLSWWDLKVDKAALAQINAEAISIKGVVNSTTTIPPVMVADKTLLKNSGTPFYQSIWFWIAAVLFASWLCTLALIWRSGKTKKKPVKMIKRELDEKDFKQACERGDALRAREYLYAWVKKQGAGRVNGDVDFSHAVEELEQVIYGKKTRPWEGRELFAAYQKFKRGVSKPPKNIEPELLPPLNP